MAIRSLTTLGIGPSNDPAAVMLARLFPRWRGESSEPTVAYLPEKPRKPAPAAAVARQLVEA